MHAADRRFSRFHPDSEVSRYDGGERGSPAADLREVLGIAARFGGLPAGAFSVRRPDGSLDTDGVVKGWAAQRAADTLTAAGLTTLLPERRRRRRDPRRARAGPRLARRRAGPVRPAAFLAVLEVRDGAVATSGTYERGEHVWDGRTGSPRPVCASATVVAADLTTADVLATCVLALGPDGSPGRRSTAPWRCSPWTPTASSSPTALQAAPA